MLQPRSRGCFCKGKAIQVTEEHQFNRACRRFLCTLLCGTCFRDDRFNPDDVSTDRRLVRRKLRSTDIDLYDQGPIDPQSLKRSAIGKQRRGAATHEKQNFLSRTELSILNVLDQTRERFAAIYRVQ